MLRLESVSKRFGTTTAVADLSLEVVPGEFLTLLGPSGCGKTTTLRMIAGFETPSAGRILLGDRDVTGLPPERRGFGMVFQNYALFPHLDVFENVAFGLRTRGTPRAEIGRKVEEALALVDLAGYGKRKVQELSGGQQQRVALARALTPEPPVLLLDEPLSNLDAGLRERTRAELRALLERVGITAIFVTHDQEEAFDLSDRVAVMQGGRLQQVGTPEMLYREPANPFVASFLGKANFLDARVIGTEGDEVVCELHGGARWRVRGAGTGGGDTAAGAGGRADGVVPVSENGGAGAAALRPGARVRIMVRPESLELLPATVPALVGGADGTATAPAGDTGEQPGGELVGTILERRFAGPVTRFRIRAADAELTVFGGPADGRPGDVVRVRTRPGAPIRAFAAD